jgi:hypothetical protein
LLALSATCPKVFRDALILYAGLKPDYTLYNGGNFRPELSTIILVMAYDASSFEDICFVIPSGCRASQLKKTIIYCDDLELLTKMFWWLHNRAAALSLPYHTVDILHSGLSSRHQDICLEAFRSGATPILLGSSKISAGMNFPGVQQVIQYRCRGLTLPEFDQRRGRGGRREGEFSVTILLVEPSMLELTMENPKSEDPGMVELIHSEECIESIIQKHLENPNPYIRPPGYDCCNRCNGDLRPPREFQWVVDPTALPASPLTTSNNAKKATTQIQELIIERLMQWRLQHWKDNWMERWPNYGPKTLVSDSDLEDVAKHQHKIKNTEDLKRYTHIVHWNDLSLPLLTSLQGICRGLGVLAEPTEEQQEVQEPTEQPVVQSSRTLTVRNPSARELNTTRQAGEIIMEF